MKIIVLAGGLSTERDVSLSSAAGICRTLVEKGHDAFLLDVFMGLENAPENLEDVFTLPDHGLEIVKNISTEEPDLEAVKASRPDQSDCFFGPNVIELCRLADITFLGLHGGEGENGKLQASFDLLGIKYTGPDSLGCAVAMHKGVAKQIFLESGVDTPGGLIDDLSDTNTSNPFAFAKTAAPAPLSPAPNITILLLIFYLIFNVTIVITAKIIPINQKRTTIFDSGTTLNGFWINACIPAFPGFWK